MQMDDQEVVISVTLVKAFVVSEDKYCWDNYTSYLGGTYASFDSAKAEVESQRNGGWGKTWTIELRPACLLHGTKTCLLRCAGSLDPNLPSLPMGRRPRLAEFCLWRANPVTDSTGNWRRWRPPSFAWHSQSLAGTEPLTWHQKRLSTKLHYGTGTWVKSLRTLIATTPPDSP
jgi:hypothetical protein